MKRTPLECGVFEDEETAQKYSRESGKWMQNVAKSFIAVAKKWGITTGRVLDVGTGPGSLAIVFAQKIPAVEVVGLDLSEVVLVLAQENAQKRVYLHESSLKKEMLKPCLLKMVHLTW